MQTNLYNLEEWPNKKWQLPFNESKCQVLHFRYNNEKRDYTMNDHCLEAVHFERDLGVIVDSELKFHRLTSTATKMANQILGIIKSTLTGIIIIIIIPEAYLKHKITGYRWQSNIVVSEQNSLSQL